jgi:hypothetical protein
MVPIRCARAQTAQRAQTKVITMAKCDACGNDYDKSFQVLARGKTHTFDSSECAIHLLAPTCEHCGVRIVGHGLEKNGRMFCCDHCAEMAGVTELRDRA